ncbi:MAG: hypothetical protein HY328_15665 [Chloroflexi bacterium]|nr:hypothetical protein [Chloroflexota bacterium]
MAECRHCGTATTGKALYCSGRCRTAAYRAKLPTAALTVVCVVCGQPFQAQRSTAKYCSRACAQKMYRRNRLEWQRRFLGRRPG